MCDLTKNSVALIIIDMQNDFLDEKGYFAVKQNWPVSHFNEVKKNIKELKEAVVKSGCKVIYTATGYSPDGSDAYTRRHNILPSIFIEKDGKPREDDSAVIKGTWGADIISELAPSKNDYVVHKRRFNAFYQTELEHMLRCWDIKTVIVTGVITEVCVESTVREAFIRDFDVLVASDGVGSWSRERHEASLRNIDFAYGRVFTTKQLIEMVSKIKNNI